MTDYVFIDPNNDHFNQYFNFTSDASIEDMNKITEHMEHNPNSSYLRLGSKLSDLKYELIKRGFTFKECTNNPDRRNIGRIPVEGIAGNY